MDAEVIVVGAGMAGLTCARALLERGVRVLVLEAQDRVGGRIRTAHVGDEAVELGAEFIHGRPPELWALAEEAGCEVYERDGAEFCFDDGSLSECSGGIERSLDPFEQLKEFRGDDISFTGYLDREGIHGDDREAAIGYAEGFNAADVRVISCAALGVQQAAEDALEGDRLFRVRGGYDALPNFLAAKIGELGGELRLATPVRAMRWQPGRVELQTEHEILSVPRCVLTLPLGLLGRRDVPITPLPEAVLHAASSLRSGDVCRFTLRFREAFWRAAEPEAALNRLSFLYSFGEMPPVWWTPHPERTNSLTGWIGGPRAQSWLALDRDAVAGKACAALARIFSVPEERVQSSLEGCFVHNWTADPYARGAYSYVAAGGLDASKRLGEPLDDTLFFAGEHTDLTGHWGTVHGAMRSGLRAAAQILEVLKFCGEA